MSDGNSFHISYFPPPAPDAPCWKDPAYVCPWPRGGWSVYQIDGDEIADRVVRTAINPKGYYEGPVTHRHSWCGYIGIFETLSEVTAAIEGVKSKM